MEENKSKRLDAGRSTLGGDHPPPVLWALAAPGNQPGVQVLLRTAHYTLRTALQALQVTIEVMRLVQR